MLTDTNIGFNKTNAVVEASLTYDVDLRNVAAPESTLTILHKNSAHEIHCSHWNVSGQIQGDEAYPINRCYWSYTRVYKQTGVALLESTPHAIPGEWMLLGKPVPAQVDELDEELAGVQGFGTLIVVPGGDTRITTFKFALPRAILSRQDATSQLYYRLHVQKQPGTLAVPLAIRIHLPGRAMLQFASMEGIQQEQSLLFKTDLRTDVDLELIFSLPD